MGSTPFVLKPNKTHQTTTIGQVKSRLYGFDDTKCAQIVSSPRKEPTKGNGIRTHGFQSRPTLITRRKASSLLLLCSSPIPITIPTQAAAANESSILDFFRMTVPDQTIKEAESGIRGHAAGLMQVKELLELESWKEAQKELRKSASYLKQDIYTIIQGKPGMERARLRNLYSRLFNGVTGLDYAARDKDVPRVWKFYEDIVVTLDDILSRV